MRFITEYCRLDQKLIRNPYILTRIGENMQQLEVLQYDTELYINTGYYTIRLSPNIQYITTIVTEFGKFRYNCLPMGMCASGDILQAKVDKLLSDIKVVKTYIGDILILIKDCFINHIEQLRMILVRLRADSLPRLCYNKGGY